ncbi:MAG: hypothetical protein UX89_C0003G0048 [Parcubacteria group bacterium GW2011_GWA2_47_16]|nr:MAG: hypothetical protein UX89_C0003G0048 [Parcubacteria group bacterium GW2011_GWA2_47_16]
MEKYNNGPLVPPAAGPKLFQKMREQIERGNLPEEPRGTEKPPELAVPIIKKVERVTENRPAFEAPKFRNGSSAMDDWQKEQEAKQEKRLKKAA